MGGPGQDVSPAPALLQSLAVTPQDGPFPQGPSCPLLLHGGGGAWLMGYSDTDSAWGEWWFPIVVTL